MSLSILFLCLELFFWYCFMLGIRRFEPRVRVGEGEGVPKATKKSPKHRICFFRKCIVSSQRNVQPWFWFVLCCAQVWVSVHVAALPCGFAPPPYDFRQKNIYVFDSLFSHFFRFYQIVCFLQWTLRVMMALVSGFGAWIASLVELFPHFLGFENITFT